MKKYNVEFVKSVVKKYVEDPAISQAELAIKVKVPLGTVVSWLRCKDRGLTPFQRYKRNRDNIIRRSWEASNARIKTIRERRNSLANTYGLTSGTVRQLIYRKTEV